MRIRPNIFQVPAGLPQIQKSNAATSHNVRKDVYSVLKVHSQTSWGRSAILKISFKIDKFYNAKKTIEGKQQIIYYFLGYIAV